jgi:hypothetical protein
MQYTPGKIIRKEKKGMFTDCLKFFARAEPVREKSEAAYCEITGNMVI